MGKQRTDRSQSWVELLAVLPECISSIRNCRTRYYGSADFVKQRLGYSHKRQIHPSSPHLWPHNSNVEDKTAKILSEYRSRFTSRALASAPLPTLALRPQPGRNSLRLA